MGKIYLYFSKLENLKKISDFAGALTRLDFLALAAVLTYKLRDEYPSNGSIDSYVIRWALFNASAVFVCFFLLLSFSVCAALIDFATVGYRDWKNSISSLEKASILRNLSLALFNGWDHSANNHLRISSQHSLRHKLIIFLLFDFFPIKGFTSVS